MTIKKNKSTKQKSSPTSSSALLDQPAGELIAALAYSIWEQEGRPDGRDVEHWLQAEAQLRLGRILDAPPGD